MRPRLAVSAFASALLVAGACVSPDSPESSGLTTFKTDTSLDAADGFSVVTLTATLDTAGLPIGSTVTFTTSLGSFLPTGTSIIVTADSFGVARAQLRAPTDSGLARLTASMNGGTLFDSVLFVRALPDKIAISTDHVVLQPNATSSPTNIAKLSAAALRTLGAPSPGVTITFLAYVPGDTTQRRGTISPAVASIASGSAAALFFADTAAAGVVRLRAELTGSLGPRIADSVDITIKP